jgi:hypothetical protein
VRLLWIVAFSSIAWAIGLAVLAVRQKETRSRLIFGMVAFMGAQVAGATLLLMETRPWTVVDHAEALGISFDFFPGFVNLAAFLILVELAGRRVTRTRLQGKS